MKMIEVQIILHFCFTSLFSDICKIREKKKITWKDILLSLSIELVIQLANSCKFWIILTLYLCSSVILFQQIIKPRCSKEEKGALGKSIV